MTQNVRAWIFLSILSAVFLITGELIGGRQGLLIGFILSLGLNFYLFFAGDHRVLKYFKVEQLKGQDPWGLHELVAALSKIIRPGLPEIYISQATTPFAFSIGRMWGQSKIVVSQGLLKRLNPEEIKSIITLQMVHIQKLHSHTSGLLGQVSELLFLGAYGLDRFLDFANIFTKKNKDFHFFQNLASPLGTFIMRLQVKHKSFFDTDSAAAKFLEEHDFTGNKQPPRELLAEVLWKLHSYATTHPIVAPPSMAPLFVVNPLTSKGINRYFQFHPRVEDRIEKLLGYYPL